MSVAASEEEVDDIEDDGDMDIGEDEVGETVMSTSDEDFEQLSPEDFEEALGDGNDDEDEDEVNEEEPTDSADHGGSEQTEDDSETEVDQPSDEELAQRSKAYEAAYQELFGQPIKASGREVQLRDVNQVRNLVEMGVDYNKKMQRMRPHMQTLKTLEQQGILEDPEKLNLLLEAQQGKPEAIKRLISEHKIDIVDMADDENASEYRPDDHIVSQNEVEIEQALNQISSSPSYNKTIEVMRTTFDDKSREIISGNPSYITALNSDIESGLYDRVMENIQYKRDVKAIPENVSDIEAYIGTVQEMAQQEQEALNAAYQQQQEGATQKNNRSTGASRKRKAAMSGSRGARKKKEPNYNPMETLSMSDAEFEKQFGDQLL